MISIIIPAYNNADEVKTLLSSIELSSGITFPFEVIVVDDGSEDSSIKDVVEAYVFARYIRLDKNEGAAAARNMGAKESKYDALFFLDSDTAVFPDTIAKIGKHFLNPDVKAFIGRLDMVPLNDGFFPRFKAIMFNSWLPKENYSTVLAPAVGGVRKDVFFESGGFDESIKGATVEYVKFSYELRQRCIIYFYPDIVVKVKLNSFRKAMQTDFYSTMKWITVFAAYRKFDNHCTTISNGLGRLFGFITIVSLPFCLMPRFYLAWLSLFLVYFCLNSSFFILILRQESFTFLLRAIITHLILSSSVVIGSISGLFILFKKQIFNKVPQTSHF